MRTIAHGAAYAAVGTRRWTVLLSYVWGGRRYRWRSKFDVEVW